MSQTTFSLCRAWLKKQGYRITQLSGDVKVLPTANPDQLALFAANKLDGVWTVEPWVSRLELEANGELLLKQEDAFITLIATSKRSLDGKRELLKKFVAAHEELTAKVTAEPDFAKPAVSAALLKATSRPISPKLLDHAWPRLKFTTQINRADFESAMKDANSVGLLPETASTPAALVAPAASLADRVTGKSQWERREMLAEVIEGEMRPALFGPRRGKLVALQDINL